MVLGVSLMLILPVILPVPGLGALTSAQIVMDFNGDKTLNMTDARDLIRIILGRSMNLRYDVNGDGKVNIVDLARTIKAIKTLGMQPGTCRDEYSTQAERCSSNKPYYCNSISVLLEDCTRCGCPEGQTCGKTGRCSGATAPGTTCTETDGGYNIYLKGTITYGGQTREESCNFNDNPPNTKVNELYCGRAYPLDNNWVTCQNGCRDGACISTGAPSQTASMIFADFWGTDSNLKIGDVVTAKDSSDVPCGSYTVVVARNYIIHVSGDDTSTTTDEGAGTDSNDNVKIYVNGLFNKTVAWPGDKSSVRMEI